MSVTIVGTQMGPTPQMSYVAGPYIQQQRSWVPAPVVGHGGHPVSAQPVPVNAQNGYPQPAVTAIPANAFRPAAPTQSASSAAPAPAGPQSEVSQPSPVVLNVYHMLPVSFDKNGRAQRRMGFGVPQFLKDLAGVYHVGIVVHGREYTFGNDHGYESRQMGGPESFVNEHKPEHAGPHLQFKEGVPLGTTSHSKQMAEQLANDLGQRVYRKGTYNKIKHNCVDFCRDYAKALGVDPPPPWVSRALDLGRMVGLGAAGAPAAAPPAPPANGGSSASASTAPGPASIPVLTEVVQSQPVGTKDLSVGQRVSVMLPGRLGQWRTGKVVGQEADGQYQVLYDNTRQPVKLIGDRIVPVPERPAGPQEEQAAAAFAHIVQGSSPKNADHYSRTLDGSRTGTWDGSRAGAWDGSRTAMNLNLKFEEPTSPYAAPQLAAMASPQRVTRRSAGVPGVAAPSPQPHTRALAASHSPVARFAQVRPKPMPSPSVAGASFAIPHAPASFNYMAPGRTYRM